MGHFYTKEGTPRFQVPNKAGTGMRDTNLPIAKELGLYPSVTEKLSNVLGAGFGLINWEVGIHLDAAYTTKQDIDLDLWKECVRYKAQEVKSQAPDLGKRIHASIEAYFKWKVSGGALEIEPFANDIKPYIRGVDRLVEEYGLVPDNDYMEKVVVNHGTKDAGTLDWRGIGWGEKRLYIDWKSQGFKNDKAFHYPKWGLQVAHYAESDGGVGGAHVVTVAIDTSKHNSANHIPLIDVKRWTGLEQLEEMYKKISDLYFFLNNWEIK